MKRWIVLAFIVPLIISGCILKKEAQTDFVPVKTPVKTVVMQEETRPKLIQYTGYVTTFPGTEKIAVNINLTEEDTKEARIGTKARIQTEKQQFSGVIAYISKTADPTTLLYPALIQVKESGLKVGQVTIIHLDFGQITGVFLPLDMIMYSEEPFVFVVIGEVVEKRRLELEVPYGYDVSVSGLEVGDEVISENATKVREGDFVKLTNE